MDGRIIGNSIRKTNAVLIYRINVVFLCKAISFALRQLDDADWLSSLMDLRYFPGRQHCAGWFDWITALVVLRTVKKPYQAVPVTVENLPEPCEGVLRGSCAFLNA